MDYVIVVSLYNDLYGIYLMLDFDIFVEYAAEFVVISIPLKSLVSTLLKESFPILCRAEFLRSAR